MIRVDYRVTWRRQSGGGRTGPCQTTQNNYNKYLHITGHTALVSIQNRRHGPGPWPLISVTIRTREMWSYRLTGLHVLKHVIVLGEPLSHSPSSLFLYRPFFLPSCTVNQHWWLPLTLNSILRGMKGRWEGMERERIKNRPNFPVKAIYSRLFKKLSI